MRVLNIETPTHGRVLIEDAAVSVSRGWLVGFHGYGQSADDIFGELQTLRAGGGWSIAAPQALHRFYTRGDQRIVASWMTREDREQAIADNIAYVNAVRSQLEFQHSKTVGDMPVVFLGFSQGASMAYRAAVHGRSAAAGVIALAGDIPPDVRSADSAIIRRTLPRVLLGAGTGDEWFTPRRLEADIEFLTAHEVSFEICRFDGGHEWTDEFRAAARAWLEGAT